MTLARPVIDLFSFQSPVIFSRWPLASSALVWPNQKCPPKPAPS